MLEMSPDIIKYFRFVMAKKTLRERHLDSSKSLICHLTNAVQLSTRDPFSGVVNYQFNINIINNKK